MNPKMFAMLSDPGSLTGRFKQVIGAEPRLTRLSQGMRFVSREEREILAIPQRQLVLVREIVMGDKNKNWLFARTLVPLVTLKGSARRIAMLDDTPIGKILFGRQGAQRRNMQLTLTAQHPASLNNLLNGKSPQLWQRRSIFDFISGPLMVNEIFLPDCPLYDF